MNTDGAFVLLLTLFGWVRRREVTSIMRGRWDGRFSAEGAAFEIVVNPRGAVELQGLLPFVADQKKAAQGILTHALTATAEPDFYRPGAGGDFVTVTETDLGQAGGVTGEGVRASGASLAAGRGTRQRKGKKGLCGFSQNPRGGDK